MELEYFKETCREYKLRLTPQRIAIYEAIIQSQSHPTTEMVYRKVKNVFSNISFNTVHQTLLTFTELRLVDLVEGFGTPRRFDPNLDDHHHFYCMVCGKIVDFNSKLYNNLPDPEQMGNGFVITRKRVVISGICRKCQDQNKKKMNSRILDIKEV